MVVKSRDEMWRDFTGLIGVRGRKTLLRMKITSFEELAEKTIEDFYRSRDLVAQAFIFSGRGRKTTESKFCLHMKSCKQRSRRCQRLARRGGCGSLSRMTFG